MIFLWIYLGIVGVAGLILAGAWSFDYDIKNGIKILWYPQWLLRRVKYDLNRAGYIILSIFSNLIFAPITIMAIVWLSIPTIALIIWEGFKYLFRKRENKDEE